MSTTTDLTEFGHRERALLVELLQAWESQGLPDDFEYDQVQPMFNTMSGNVFLTNEEYQVAMMNGDKLESFYSCGNCGKEGFKEDFEEYTDDNCDDCLEQF